MAKPDAGFNAGIAMQRNKYIYVQSEATVVVKSDYNKGGHMGRRVGSAEKGLLPGTLLRSSAVSGEFRVDKAGGCSD